MLRRLHTTGVETHAPRPLGSGLLGPFAWSAETAASGRPLAEVVASTRHSTNIQSVLEDLASWFTELGAATRTVRTWSGEDGLALRGEHRGLSAVRAALSDVPGVLVHGDVGTGLNVLVDRRSFNVIDWETAAVAELPLTDLLPLVSGAGTVDGSPESGGCGPLHPGAVRREDAGESLASVRRRQVLPRVADPAGTGGRAGISRVGISGVDATRARRADRAGGRRRRSVDDRRRLSGEELDHVRRPGIELAGADRGKVLTAHVVTDATVIPARGERTVWLRTE